MKKIPIYLKFFQKTCLQFPLPNIWLDAKQANRLVCQLEKLIVDKKKKRIICFMMWGRMTF